MEKDYYFVKVTSSSNLPNWQSSSSSMNIGPGNVNYVSEQLQSGLLNWENSLDHSAPFESALSSVISSAAPATTSYSSNTSCYNSPLNCTPKLNPSTITGNPMIAHPNLAPFSTDPGFAERAAKFSCFGSGNFGGLTGQLGFPETELQRDRSVPSMGSGKLSRVSSSQSLKAGSQMGVLDTKETGLPVNTEMMSASASASASDRKFSGLLSRSSTPETAEFGSVHEESSSPSDRTTGGDLGFNSPNEMNARKRKAITRGKPKELPSSPSSTKDHKAVKDGDSNAKRSKSAEVNTIGKDALRQNAEEKGNQNTSDGGQKETNTNQKLPEPPKQDYIHVRARRGQATDSHSLAERVRREKISERMKFLQDLVPGCNKVTGKAVMLDEIINYVQSLQRQVEFLSMKLANVNPRLDFNMDTLLSKDILQSGGTLPHPFDSPAPALLYGQQPQHGPKLSIASNGSEIHSSLNLLDLHRNLGAQLQAIDGCGDASSSQIANFWEDDLQSVVQMGFGQNEEMVFLSQSFHGSLPSSNHMKTEL